MPYVLPRTTLPDVPTDDAETLRAIVLPFQDKIAYPLQKSTQFKTNSIASIGLYSQAYGVGAGKAQHTYKIKLVGLTDDEVQEFENIMRLQNPNNALSWYVPVWYEKVHFRFPNTWVIKRVGVLTRPAPERVRDYLSSVSFDLVTTSLTAIPADGGLGGGGFKPKPTGNQGS